MADVKISDLTDGTAVAAGDLVEIERPGSPNVSRRVPLGNAAGKSTGTSAGNVPVLDGSGKLDSSTIPAVAITDVFVVASQVAMLALTAEKGDIAIRTDLNKSFALQTNSPSTLADWKELLTPTDAVLAVAGLTGSISASALKTALTLVKADVGLGNVANVAQLTQGRHSIWVPAAAMWARATSGAEAVTYDSGSNDVTILGWAFDTTTQEYVHFGVAMPKSWNAGTVTFVPYWTNGGGSSTQNVVYSLAGRALKNDDAINGSFGTTQTSNDTWLAQNDMHIGPESSAITIGNSPAAGALVIFEASRVVGSDNMAGDAVLAGVMLFITINAGDDT